VIEGKVLDRVLENYLKDKGHRLPAMWVGGERKDTICESMKRIQ
jgi:hypothetical protein